MTYTVRQISKEHGYVMQGDKYLCTASMQDCERIAEAMNRREREDGEGK